MTKDAQNSISKDTDEFLTHQANMWTNATRNTELALWEAEHYWDKIFHAKSKPSQFEEILGNLINTLLPIAAEFAMFAGVLRIATMTKRDRVKSLEELATNISRRKAERLARAKKALKNAQEEFTERTETLKEAGAHASVEIYKGVSEGNEKGEAQDEEELQSEAKLQFIEDLLEQCREARDYIEECRHKLFGAVDKVTPAEAGAEHDWVVKEWTRLMGGFAQPYREGKGGTLKQLALLILYDMLQLYCKKNVRLYLPYPGRHQFPISKEKALAMAEKERAEASKPRFEKGYLVPVFPHDAEKKALTLVEFDGFDPAQRAKIYYYVGQIENAGPSRPIFKDWVDLIKAWKFASG